MLTITDWPTTGNSDAHALIQEAKRRRRRRRRTIAIGTVIAVTAVSGYLLFRTGGPPRPALHPRTPSIVGVLPNARAYRSCPGSAQVGPKSAPDFLPAASSQTGNLALAVNQARALMRANYGFTHSVAQLPSHSHVEAVRVVPGAMYVWTKAASGQVRVIHIKNYGIDVYLKAAADCPTGGWVRMVANGFQVTFLAPRSTR